jgi:hypothetical protein
MLTYFLLSSLWTSHTLDVAVCFSHSPSAACRFSSLCGESESDWGARTFMSKSQILRVNFPRAHRLDLQEVERFTTDVSGTWMTLHIMVAFHFHSTKPLLFVGCVCRWLLSHHKSRSSSGLRARYILILVVTSQYFGGYLANRWSLSYLSYLPVFQSFLG